MLLKSSVNPIGNPSPVNDGGFSLLEISLVIFITGVMLSGIFLPVSSMQESRRRDATEDTLGEVVEALYGFAQSILRLPCPATATSNS